MDKGRVYNYLFKSILGFVFLTGILLRSVTYLYNRSFWHDEASLALSIIRDVNLFTPLPHNQFAPQLFLFSTKILSIIFSCSEMVLRFIPFIFGIFSIFIFYLLSKEFLQNKLSIIAANFLFAINYHIIYYCQEFKQYSTDVFFFMLALLIFSKIDFNKINIKTYFLVGFIILFSTMVSLSILFVTAAWFCVGLLKHKLSAIKTFLKFTPYLIVFLIYYIFVLAPAQSNVELGNLNYWDSGYLRLNLLYILKLIKNCFEYCFTPNHYVLISLIFSCFGWYFIAKNKEVKPLYSITFCAFLFVLLASFLHMYPLDGRAGLFLTPIVILTVIIPLDRSKWYYLILLLPLFIVNFSGYNFNYLKTFFNNNVFAFKNSREITKILKDKFTEGDVVVYNIASDSDYEYYTHLLNLEIKNFVVLQLPNEDDKTKIEILKNSLSYLQKGKYYIFYIGYDRQSKQELPLLKKWLADKNIIWEYDKNGSYIVKIKL